MNDLSKEKLMKATDVLVNMCLHFLGAQYTEETLRSYGFGDEELKEMGFDVEV